MNIKLLLGLASVVVVRVVVGIEVLHMLHLFLATLAVRLSGWQRRSTTLVQTNVSIPIVWIVLKIGTHTFIIPQG